MGVLEELSELLQRGRAVEVKALAQSALDAGVPARTILEQGLMAGMGVVGGKFKRNEIYVPEVLIAARAMNAGIDVLKPHLGDRDRNSKGKVVIGTVKGDLHDIGKNLVKIMMEGKGLEVIDLGTDVAPERFVAAARDNGARIIACSALLTTTMTEMASVVKAVNEAGLRDKVTIMVGGAPLTEGFCRSIQADLYAPDAASAADAAVEALSKAS